MVRDADRRTNRILDTCREMPTRPPVAAPPAIDLPLCRDKGVRHIGVVFVHGIGSQAEGEILREWGDAITQVLVDFRIAAGLDGDPVLATQLDPTATGRIFVELELPATDGAPAIPEEHWLLTEAWWAHEITPPTFGSMARWLGPGGAVPRIVKTIIPRSSGDDDPRALPASPEPDGISLPPAEDLATRAAAAPAGLRDRAQRAMQDLRAAPRVTTRNWLVEVGAWAYLQAASALLLLVYGVLRTIESLIPIGPLANGALTRPIDRFVLEWFGDVFVLLTVPTQAASVRGRLTRAIDDLRTAGAEQVVVIAHSGGAIVSWTTLVDDEHAQVDQLVTIGEGLNLGWNITSGNGTIEDQAALLDGARHRFRLLYESLMRAQPDLIWVDYWGSRDPAPSGPLDPPDPDLQPPREPVHEHAGLEPRLVPRGPWRVLGQRRGVRHPAARSARGACARWRGSGFGDPRRTRCGPTAAAVASPSARSGASSASSHRWPRS